MLESEGCKSGAKGRGFERSEKVGWKEGRESEECERVRRESKRFERGARVGCERGRVSRV